jgi:alkaline phosphatase
MIFLEDSMPEPKTANFRFCVPLLLILALIVGQAASQSAPAPAPPQWPGRVRVDNVILMIPDGMGTAAETLGRWYKYARTGSNHLVMDDWACGLIRTYWATGLITDSAPAAAAMATGFKSSAGAVSVLAAKVSMPDVPPLPDGGASSPVATVLEAARRKGLGTGLVVTCEFPHATPAGFASHYIQRSQMNLLGEQMVYQDMDVVLGGGRKYLDPASRPDKEDLVKVLRDRGYLYVTDRTQMLEARSGKLWGAFGDTGMERDLDRDPAKEPSLAEMTRKALQILSQKKKGFFLMVEGSQIDWAEHANDPAGCASEVLAFDEAVKTAFEFARADGHTAILIAPDHSTGGMSIGNQEIGDLPMDRFDAVMRAVKATPTKTARDILGGGPVTMERSLELIKANLGIDGLKKDELSRLEDLLKGKDFKKLELFLSRAFSARLGAGWVFTGHSGEDVPLWAYHPRKIRPEGVIQNTDIGRYIAAALDLKLAAQTRELFVPAAAGFASAGATTVVDAADPQNPVLVVNKELKTLRLPVNKCVAELDGRTVELGGVVVCTAPVAGRQQTDPTFWFVPRKAIELLKP